MCVSDVYSFPSQTFQNVPWRSLTDLDAFTLCESFCSCCFFLHFLIKFTLTVIRISLCTVTCCGDNFQKVLVKTSNLSGIFCVKAKDLFLNICIVFWFKYSLCLHLSPTICTNLKSRELSQTVLPFLQLTDLKKAEG